MSEQNPTPQNNPLTLTDADPVYFWGGYINTPNGSVVFAYSVGTLQKVAYDWVINEPFPRGKPEIMVITGCRKLSQRELELVEQQKKVLEDI